MDARIFVPILPILGILAVRMMDIRTRHPKKTIEMDGRTQTAFRNSVAISNPSNNGGHPHQGWVPPTLSQTQHHLWTRPEGTLFIAVFPS